MFEREGGGGGTRRHVDLGEDVREVPGDGLLAEGECARRSACWSCPVATSSSTSTSRALRPAGSSGGAAVMSRRFRRSSAAPSCSKSARPRLRTRWLRRRGRRPADRRRRGASGRWRPRRERRAPAIVRPHGAASRTRPVVRRELDPAARRQRRRGQRRAREVGCGGLELVERGRRRGGEVAGRDRDLGASRKQPGAAEAIPGDLVESSD